MYTISRRTVGALVLIGALVLAAGCSGLGLGDGGTGANATAESTATDTDATDTAGQRGDAGGTVADERTNSTATEASSDDGHGHGHSHGGGAGTENQTAAGTDTATGNGTAAGNATDADGTMNASSAAASGKITVVVAGSELDLAARDRPGDGFGVAASDEHTWVGNGTNRTLAEALSRFGVEANASQVAADGERYRARTDGTTLTYRVDGEPVDPTEYVLESGDEVWTTVRTAETNLSTPGDYIRADQYHAHGSMTFVVDGEELNFSKAKYQSNHRYFHYENGGGEQWHAHSWAVTLDFALDSLTGIHASDGAITYEGTTYDPDDPGTSVDVTVNGESVSLDDYVLEDGDSVRVVVESGS